MSVSAPVDLHALVAGTYADPHRILGPHGDVVRAWRPDASAITLVLPATGERIDMTREHPAGVFVATGVKGGVTDYRLDVTYPGGDTWLVDDPYRFWPTLGDIDLYLLGEGRHERLWKRLGARPTLHQDATGTAFAVWAPAARSVRVVGDFNGWDGRLNPMRMIGSSGVWEIFLPGVGHGARYKFEIVTPDGSLTLKADPLAVATEAPPNTASVVFESSYEWADDDWLRRRAASNPWGGPMSVYECHFASWRHVPEDGDRPLTYREMAEQLPAYLVEMGFTHVEFLPMAEHPFGGSWGYQVTSYYAPTARFGTPDDFRFLVDALHRAGIGVIVDWVPAHFPKDSFALARFDGTALYEHADPRQGEHPDWGTLVFNFGRHEVANFLLANALYWIEELHVDGLRVDAVASMLYLDYSREEGQWVPNKFGGRENLESVEFLRQLNTLVHAECPGALTIAEESTSWPGVSRPVYLGGLGFGFKWNMGWMHDTLTYFSKEPVYRRHHHQNLTFGLLYAFSENFVLPISHDEVVHGKGSLVNKMPGDKGTRLANLRALLAWMWAHPGKQLLFMGCEIAQEREWSHDRSLDWNLLDDGGHRGVQELVAAMNRIYREEPALWEADFDGAGFSWIDANDADGNVLSFARFSADGGQSLVCVANLSGSDRRAYRIGVPMAGSWEVVLDTTMANGGTLQAEPQCWHGRDQSLTVNLAPLSVVWLVHRS
ncbi:MAG: 1,4-alpha-glucan branching protein GlgB [Actinomycetota bacterium]|nr:1,4-alpha-glucan branching protein GlgB [Actinomycetota bacterium]